MQSHTNTHSRAGNRASGWNKPFAPLLPNIVWSVRGKILIVFFMRKTSIGTHFSEVRRRREQALTFVLKLGTVSTQIIQLINV